MGYGVVRTIGTGQKLLALGVVDLRKIGDPYLKIRHIFERTQGLIDEYHPDELAIEAPFYGKNVQSMLKLGRAQGTAIAAALTRDLPIFEYAPRKIKLAITGQGSASKEQVAGMLKQILRLESIPDNLDATDGLAAAVCHTLQKDLPGGEKSTKSWKEFIRKNPGRIR